MDDPTMYMCMEIIALLNLLWGKIAPPPPPPKQTTKKQWNTCSFFSKRILDITVFTLNIRHRKCSDTLFFSKKTPI